MSQGGKSCRATGTATDEKEEDVKPHTESRIAENVEHTESPVMHYLPNELWWYILSFCDMNSWGRLRRVSHRLKSIADGYIASFPRSAVKLRERRGKDARDGEYYLAVTSDRFGIVPLRVYCHGMSTGAPKEYITLRHNGPDDNFSKLIMREAGHARCVTTSFSKVRLDMAKMQLVCNDFTFAQSEGWGGVLYEDGVETWHFIYEEMPLGTAQTIGYGWQPRDYLLAKAKVDLRGTGLCVNCSFDTSGWDANGHCEFKEGRQVVTITGAGWPEDCGPTSAMIGRYTAWDVESNAFSIVLRKAWDIVTPVLMKVEIARRGNPS